MALHLKRTKIIATLGPSTDRNNNLEKIINAGVDIVRLNFSHGNISDHYKRAKKVRKISFNINRYISILGDLQGPKIRIASFINGNIVLKSGDVFLLDESFNKDQGNNEIVGLSQKGLCKNIKINDILLLDDGKIKLQVFKINNFQIFTKVIIGGKLSNNKGILKLGGGLFFKNITKKDKEDIINAAKIGVDYLAVSFPSSSKDLNYVRKLARNAGSNAKIISKIERAEVVLDNDSIDDLILASDAVMIARGDLGIEIGENKLVGAQKKIIDRAICLNKAVIIATQMMESMIYNSIPTRAEIMDVANSVLDGADAVMLSAETATGKYPVETVSSMFNICLGAEDLPSIKLSKHRVGYKFENIEETIAMSAMYAANHLSKITAVILIDHSDYVSLIMSRINSILPIFLFSSDENILKFSNLYRGVFPIYFEKSKISQENISYAINILKKNNFIFTNDLVLIVLCNDLKSTINTIKIIRVF